jgi:hypothetical protein
MEYETSTDLEKFAHENKLLKIQVLKLTRKVEQLESTLDLIPIINFKLARSPVIVLQDNKVWNNVKDCCIGELTGDDISYLRSGISFNICDLNKKCLIGVIIRMPEYGNVKCIKIMISRGVDVNYRDNMRKTPLIYCIETLKKCELQSKLYTEKKCIIYARMSRYIGDLNIIKKLLIRAGAK